MYIHIVNIEKIQGCLRLAYTWCHLFIFIMSTHMLDRAETLKARSFHVESYMPHMCIYI